MKKSFFVLMVFASVLAMGCTLDSPAPLPVVVSSTPTPSVISQSQASPQILPLPTQQLVIKTGTSFGECKGYCHKEITITSEKIVFRQNGWDQKELLEINGTAEISKEQWNKITSLVDLEKFNSLPERLGCPDCTDGGAEWIEIFDGKTSKRVTFEYGASIPEINGLVNELRVVRNGVF